jgi:protein gp37
MRSQHPNAKIREHNAGLNWKASPHFFNGQIRMRKDNLFLPVHVNKPTAFAIWNDLFHEDVSDDFIVDAFRTMWTCNDHMFFVLTKRPERMRDVMESVRESFAEDDYSFPAENVWIGVTAENQEQADKRIQILLQVPSAKRYVSIEPMLGPVELRISAFNGADSFSSMAGIHWVICGGESGPGSRPMHPAWVLELLDQCQAAGVPFFFKQWGEFGHESQIDFNASPFAALSSRNAMYHAWPGGSRSYRIGKSAAGRLLDGKEYIEVPKI